MSKNWSKWILWSALCLVSLPLTQAQNFTSRNSPYSRYGLGDMQSPSFIGNRMTAGAFSATHQSIFNTDLNNPASLANLRFTAFETGVYYKAGDMREEVDGITRTAQANEGGPTYLSLAFPITKSWVVAKDSLRKQTPIQWTTGISLLPFSYVGYDVQVESSLDNIGAVRYDYIGEGGLYRMNWANAVGYKNFSLGLNMSYLFGQTKNTQRVLFQDASYNYAFNNGLENARSVRGFYWDVGAQYTWILQEDAEGDAYDTQDKRLVFGVYGHGGTSLSAEDKQFYVRSALVNGVDTIRNANIAEGTISLPAKLGFGVSYRARNKFSSFALGLNVELGLWENYKNSLTVNDRLENTTKASLGMKWAPRAKSNSRRSWYARPNYHAGVFYESDPRVVELTQLHRYGINFGLELPVKLGNTPTAIQLGIELGQMGHPDLILENYARINFGVTLNDSEWFKQSKYR